MDDIIDLNSDAYFMGEALRQAHKAARADEVPIGAVIAHEGQIIARAFNQVETLKDATAHAEMLAITQAESVLGAAIEIELHSAVPELDADEVCSRCGSDEIFPVESRAKTFARILLLTWIAFLLINLASCGLHLQRNVIGIAYAAPNSPARRPL